MVWEDGRCEEEERGRGGKVGEEHKEDGEKEWWWRWWRGLEKSRGAAELLLPS